MAGYCCSLCHAPWSKRAFPDAAALHGRQVQATTPVTPMLIAHLVALNR
ncbi:hypothetical protein OKW39_008546 [Paraburkholderia sp. MM6662-R1]